MSDLDEDRARKAGEVLKLAYGEGLGVRAIARRLRMARKTVRKLLAVGGERQARPRAERATMLGPYDGAIRRALEETPDLQAPALIQQLRPLGYAGGLTILRARLRELRPRAQREAFLTLDFPPGQAVQVDWADFGFALPGCPRRVSAFVMALCYSRMLYLEFTLSQKMGSFLRCMERGLRFFGGTTKVDIFDNMKTVVLSHTPAATVFNSQFLEYARVRRFATVACNVRRGNEKGIVERPIGFIRGRFWPTCHPTDLLDLNTKAAEWRDSFANNREHEQTGKVPALVFEHEERRLLKPVTETPFNTDDIDTATISKSFRVRFDRNLYSVPPHLVGQSVVIRATDSSVMVFLGPKLVASHARSWDTGADIEAEEHRKAACATKPRAAGRQLPSILDGLGDVGLKYFKVLSAGMRSIRHELTRLTLLVELFGASATAAAMDEVMRTGQVGAEYVEYVLRYKRGLAPSSQRIRLGVPELDDLALHEPDLGLYDQLARPAMTRAPGDPPPAPEETSHETT